jgi:hypothetical protein
MKKNPGRCFDGYGIVFSSGPKGIRFGSLVELLLLGVLSKHHVSRLAVLRAPAIFLLMGWRQEIVILRGWLSIVGCQK